MLDVVKRSHLLEYTFGELLSVYYFDGHLLSGNAMDAHFHQTCNVENYYVEIFETIFNRSAIFLWKAILIAIIVILLYYTEQCL